MKIIKSRKFFFCISTLILWVKFKCFGQIKNVAVFRRLHAERSLGTLKIEKRKSCKQSINFNLFRYKSKMLKELGAIIN